MDNKDHSNDIKPVEIKDLNKTQLILLAILLSFITSIATGIVTVTLMQQAPTGVTQTINRVVQNTIEKVVPDYIPGQTQTVVVKEDDLVVDAVQKTRVNFAPLFTDKDAKDSFAAVYSLGGGTFITTNATIDTAKTYTIKEGDKFVDVKVIGVSPLGFSVLSAAAPDALSKALPVPTLGKDADIKTGQSAVLVGESTIKKGIVQSVKKTGDEKTGTTDVIALDTTPGDSSIGSLVVNLDGDIIGFVVPGAGAADTTVVGIDAVTKFIAHPSLPTPKPAPTPDTTPAPVPAV